ncbi:MAG: MotA/TolQ/ExbB proton channel family protein [Pseudomonadota bacterium]
MRLLAAITALLLSFFSVTSHAWWNEDWSLRKKITLTNPAGEVTDAPVLIRLHTGNFDFLSANEDGSDLRVVAGDDATELKFHIEKWDGLNQLALVWVKLPKLGATTEAWLYFGNPEAPPASDAKGSYDAGSAVYHFNELAGNPADSGPAGANATAFTGTRIAASFANGGAKFDGTQSLTLPPVAGQGGWSVSLWLKPTAPDGALLQADGLSAALAGGVLSVQAGGANVAAAAPLADGTWQHVAVVVEGATLRLYVDGKPAGEAGGAALPAGPLTLGRGFSGEVDELHLAGAARSAAWVAVAAAQGPQGTLVALGEDEGGESGGHGGIWGTLFQALTLDGWIAIGVLAVMLVIAVWVMIAKAIYVNKVDKANQAFLEKFRELSSDLGALDKSTQMSETFRDSSLYRLYHIASQELSHRMPDTDARHLTEQQKNLSPQALDSIRASLDTGLVRESGLLTRLMVLLTIAISGGPFIGLLGTVLGVMITFAVIAATGDVNVNAIAPGIAAALMATAAGMAVAIPALFGYNYLNSRIKTITSDMRVFIDELVTKLAENYSR